MKKEKKLSVLNKVVDEVDKIDEAIQKLNDAGAGGLLSGPWIDEHQEKYNQKVIDYVNGDGPKPDVVLVDETKILKEVSDSIGIETLIIIRDGKLGKEVLRNPFHSAFFMKQIVEEGLEGFHITIESGISDDEKSEIIQEMVDTWDNNLKEITDL